MPTGYTADIYDGKDVSFEDFVWKCARGFGALISLRDEPNAGIPDEFKVDEYYERRLQEATEEFKKAQSMTDEDFALEAERTFRKETEYLTGYIEEKKKLRKRYENMLEQVVSWTPPTENHVELKNMMINQLEVSIRGEASTDRVEKELAELSLKTVEEMKARVIEDCEWHLNRAKEQLEVETVAAKEHTEWVSALRRSLTK